MITRSCILCFQNKWEINWEIWGNWRDISRYDCSSCIVNVHTVQYTEILIWRWIRDRTLLLWGLNSLWYPCFSNWYSSSSIGSNPSPHFLTSNPKSRRSPKGYGVLPGRRQNATQRDDYHQANHQHQNHQKMEIFMSQLNHENVQIITKITIIL